MIAWAIARPIPIPRCEPRRVFRSGLLVPRNPVFPGSIFWVIRDYCGGSEICRRSTRILLCGWPVGPPDHAGSQRQGANTPLFPVGRGITENRAVAHIPHPARGHLECRALAGYLRTNQEQIRQFKRWPKPGPSEPGMCWMCSLARVWPSRRV